MRNKNSGHPRRANAKWLKASLWLMVAGTSLCAYPGAVYAKSAAVAGPVSINSQIILAAGSPNGSTLALTVPKGFYLVVQTVSYFRSDAVAGSISNLFIQTNYNKVIGYIAVPEAVADGNVYPSATLNATFYCGPGTQVIVNAYRNGSDTDSETDNLNITGYYVAEPTS